MLCSVEVLADERHCSNLGQAYCISLSYLNAVDQPAANTT